MAPDFDPVYQKSGVAYKRLKPVESGAKAGAIVSGYVPLRQAFAQARYLYIILAEDIALDELRNTFWLHNTVCRM